MASMRHRPLPRPSSSSRNPFDSSDDEKDAPKARPVHHAYQNPFDAEDADANVSRKNSTNALRPPPASSKPVYQATVKNPFDDDDEHVEKEENYEHERQGSLKDKLDQGTLFDEQPSFYGGVDMQERKSTSKSSAASALKKVGKIKDAGAAQATRMVGGGINQASRLKERSVNAFKSAEANTNPSEQERSKPLRKHTNEPRERRTANSNGSVHARSQLLAEDVPPSAGSKGDLSGGGTGLFESSAPRAFRASRFDEHQFQGSELEQRSVQELEGYALHKSEDTTKSVQNCLKVAEEIKGDATNTLLTLHQQGEQLRRAHAVAHDIDESLTTGEKLLGSLGGMFSRTWKPRKGPAIKGPVDDPNDSESRRKAHHLQHRTALGLDHKAQKDQAFHGVSDSQAQTMDEKLEVERAKQDDALSDLSNVLGQLKDMTIDMGSEISRQNVAMDSFHDDLVVLNDRVKGANVRGRHLLKK